MVSGDWYRGNARLFGEALARERSRGRARVYSMRPLEQALPRNRKRTRASFFLQIAKRPRERARAQERACFLFWRGARARALARGAWRASVCLFGLRGASTGERARASARRRVLDRESVR